ncbi:YbaB/EbfC family nucleoid-associated protein [Calderihabitans maritimus]|uniref:Nucleoid-associated protein KKC1_00230 n=1 Tax=Calderihabitans maritimus TaxID=1246530 RepID=A0A1Z5HNF5_9FIRM|nr:YbaB/EbfC family nucleoid-associated protein [Calderihabitans maritimus]GAW90861.1 hypothetical protein DGI_0202 [Calderihabitans maritimus]
MPDLNELFKQAQKLKNEISRVREELKVKTVEASVANGKITIVANGHQEVQKVKLDPSVRQIKLSDLEEQMLSAINQVMQKSREMAKREMAKITGGIDLTNVPGLF